MRPSWTAAKALVRATGGRLVPVRVTGPVGDPVDSFLGFLGGPRPRTAVVEMAAAAGLSLVPRDRRNPMLTTSAGVGELIRAALDLGVGRILVGCGDSGINDGGAGLAQALGARLVGENGAELRPVGGELLWLHRLDLAGLDPRLNDVRIDAAVNWHNMLLGPKGVDRTFDHGIAACASILKRPCTLDEAIRDGEKLLRRAAQDAMRRLSAGLRLSDRPDRAA